MRIALAQMQVVPGNVKRNLETMLHMIDEAKQVKADVIAFPEMCVGGYLLGDKWTSTAFCEKLMEANEVLQKASSGIAIAYGNIFVDDQVNARVGDAHFHPNEDGRVRKYNAVYVFQNGKPAERTRETPLLPQGIQPKTLLPTYRIFDDERYFTSLKDVAQDFGKCLEDLTQPFTLEIDGKKVSLGFEICEDLWCEDYRKNGRAMNPTKMLIDNGAALIVNISASPWTFGKNDARDRRVQFLKKDSAEKFVPFLYVNCTGVQNNGKNFVTFDGGTTAYNKDGLPVKLLEKPYEEDILLITKDDLEGKVVRRIEKPKIVQKYQAIQEGLLHVRDTYGAKEHPRWVIGLSGGIDSAVVAATLVHTFGPDSVLGVNMPSRYNSEKTKNAAKNLADKLGISYISVPIEEIVEVNQRTIDSVDPFGTRKKLSEFNLENLQAKIRGTSILSNLAAKYGALFTNNGNKLEVALGYATLYGDWGGAIAPIGDLTKTEVVALAKYLNREVFKDEVIPESVIPHGLWQFREDQIQPSAELKDKQIDPMKFMYHCALLEAMTDYKKHEPEDLMQSFADGTLHKKIDVYMNGLVEEHNIGYDLMKRWGVDNANTFVQDLEWFTKTMQSAVFKRVQSPPIIITSKTAFGYDLRESIMPWYPSQRYEELKQKVLKQGKYIPKETS